MFSDLFKVLQTDQDEFEVVFPVAPASNKFRVVCDPDWDTSCLALGVQGVVLADGKHCPKTHLPFYKVLMKNVILF